MQPHSPMESRLATISTLLACMRTDQSNAELLAVVADLAQRFSAAVIGVAARQLSLHSTIMAIGPGEPRGRRRNGIPVRLVRGGQSSVALASNRRTCLGACRQRGARGRPDRRRC